MLVTTNVIQRTFCIQCKDKDGKDTRGTVFAIDHDNREYLVTARHVVKEVSRGSPVQVLRNGEWMDLPASLVGMGVDETDIAVLTNSYPLGARHPIGTSSGGLHQGQDVRLVGFPFLLNSGGEEINNGFPIPLVKSGVVSGLKWGGPGPNVILIDAQNNDGFSGGPVICLKNGEQSSEPCVIGVVTARQAISQLVEDVEGNRSRSEQLVTAGGHTVTLVEDQGFTIAIAIEHAIELIEANPIGVPLPAVAPS